jgi:hypothetical protein
MKHLLTFLSALLFLPLAMHAQSIGPSEMNAAGKSVFAGSNTYEYAIGTVVAGNTFQSSSLIVTQGVLQPLIEEPNGVHEPGISSDNLSVYPNPVEQTLFLKPAFGKKGKLEYVLLDGAGRTIMKNSAALEQGNELQEIPMSSYAVGQYTLSVTWQHQGQSKSTAYKIQKIK